MNDSRKRGLNRLQGLRKQQMEADDVMQSSAFRFEALRDKEPTRAVSAFNLFQTPEAIADMMVRRLGSLQAESRILEPSAGLGRLYTAIRHRSMAPVTLVEFAPQCAAELYRSTCGDEFARLVQDDFLQCSAERLGGLFDFVVMNPPFKQGRDIKHIHHAFSLLKPGGRLVSLCYDGIKQRAVFSDGWNWERLPEDSFKSEGTRASVAMIWKEKP